MDLVWTITAVILIAAGCAMCYIGWLMNEVKEISNNIHLESED